MFWEHFRPIRAQYRPFVRTEGSGWKFVRNTFSEEFGLIRLNHFNSNSLKLKTKVLTPLNRKISSLYVEFVYMLYRCSGWDLVCLVIFSSWWALTKPSHISHSLWGRLGENHMDDPPSPHHISTPFGFSSIFTFWRNQSSSGGRSDSPDLIQGHLKPHFPSSLY